ncbi:hypothetical protein [Achromobacter xylosoxidans]|nr:hypothetical protein [Achromobacter xylosoxidans]
MLAGIVAQAVNSLPKKESHMVKFIEALLDILAPTLNVLDRNGKL